MNLEDVEAVVDETISKLPEEFKVQMDNVGVVVEIWPTEQELKQAHVPPHSLLYGLYTGVPKTQRTTFYSSLPDKITIFAGPILMVSHNIDDAKKRIKDTVLHEIGHHFGMSEEQLKQLRK